MKQFYVKKLRAEPRCSMKTVEPTYLTFKHDHFQGDTHDSSDDLLSCVVV